MHHRIHFGIGNHRRVNVIKTGIITVFSLNIAHGVAFFDHLLGWVSFSLETGLYLEKTQYSIKVDMQGIYFRNIFQIYLVLDLA
jgi:hypothetical protein